MFAVLIVFYGCKNDHNFTISGRITHAEGKKIYLEEVLVSSTRPVDEVEIDKNGEFEFKGRVSIPKYYMLKLSGNNFITLLVDSLDDVFIEADIANFSREYNVEGSAGSSLVKKLNDKLFSTRARLDSLESVKKLYGATASQTILDEEYNRIKQEQIEFSTSFVMENPFSMASILALYQKFDDTDQNYILRDLQTMRTAASALNSIYPESEHVKALYQNTLQYLQEQQAAQVQKFIQEQGENSPDIVLPDPDGREIALSSLRGKIVLLQFWAAEDRASRVVNPVLVEIYEKYKNKGFEIYQVSIDENRIEWIDAIDKDRLSWINVGDMKGSIHVVNVYNIQTIPYNYLLDEEGIIIAKDLKGPNLDRAISKLLEIRASN